MNANLMTIVTAENYVNVHFTSFIYNDIGENSVGSDVFRKKKILNSPFKKSIKFSWSKQIFNLLIYFVFFLIKIQENLKFWREVYSWI